MIQKNGNNWPCSFQDEVKNVECLTHDRRRTTTEKHRWPYRLKCLKEMEKMTCTVSIITKKIGHGVPQLFDILISYNCNWYHKIFSYIGILSVFHLTETLLNFDTYVWYYYPKFTGFFLIFNFQLGNVPNRQTICSCSFATFKICNLIYLFLQIANILRNKTRCMYHCCSTSDMFISDAHVIHFIRFLILRNDT